LICDAHRPPDRVGPWRNLIVRQILGQPSQALVVRSVSYRLLCAGQLGKGMVYEVHFRRPSAITLHACQRLDNSAMSQNWRYRSIRARHMWCDGWELGLLPRRVSPMMRDPSSIALTWTLDLILRSQKHGDERAGGGLSTGDPHRCEARYHWRTRGISRRAAVPA